jgi:fibronectin-binding autotransporter adhesin
MGGSGLFQVQNTNSAGAPDFEQIPMLRSSSPTAVVENGAAVGPVQLRVGGGTGARVGAFDGSLRDGTGGGALSVMLNNFSGAVYWRLGGTNSHTGDTVVTNGFTSGFTRLIVNGLNTGGGNYFVGGGAASSLAVLGGGGSITAGTVNLNANSVLAPGGVLNGTTLYTRQGGGASGAAGINTGTFAESIAKLTINGAVTLADGSSSLDIHLNGTTAGSGYDQVDITGSGSLANNSANLQLTIDLGFIPAEGNQFTLVQVQGTDPANNTGVFATLNGAAADLSQGATNQMGSDRFRISYRAEGSTFDAGPNGNDIMI